VGVEPIEPELRHVWVSEASGTAPTTPGLVVCWQHSPVHSVTQPDWNALVVTAPFADAALVQWVPADRLVPITDPTPVERP
jgi:hypothetical protein